VDHFQNLIQEYKRLSEVAFISDDMKLFVQNQKRLEELARQIKSIYPENRFNNHVKEEG
jgi:hypothetical protein